MAIFNVNETFSFDQAVTGPVESTNTYDRGVPGRWVHGTSDVIDDEGNSMVPLLVQVTEAFAGNTALTLAFQQSDTEDFADAETIYEEEIAVADLTVGKRFRVRYVPHDVTKRYVRMFYTPAGSPSAGKVTAAYTCVTDSYGVR
ncbi:Bbp16 family capsid cement protein [uncultured Tateyamaria sp.]|uniref:Bbp16 family capsid cement protein n=1 Tax=uncultured Tateyamaria sp. TaxID=455651 RepID=UPI0026062F05|nr:hypothetical protein [uncultured Tateyamaria sp.]